MTPRRWGSREHASAIRSAVLLIWLVILVKTPYGDLAVIPRDMPEPFGVGRLLQSDPRIWSFLWQPATLTLLKLAAISACLIALLRPRSGRLTLPIATISIVLLDAVVKSIGGFANHAQLAPLYVLIVVAAFPDVACVPFGSRCNSKRRFAGYDTSHAVLVWIVASTLVVPYTFIGLHRLVTGGVAIFTGDAMLWYIAGATKALDALPWTPPVGIMSGLLSFGFVAMTLLECCAVGLLVWHRFRVWWLPLMTLFHLAIVFLMNIAFWENVVLLWVTFWAGWSSVGADVLGNAQTDDAGDSE